MTPGQVSLGGSIQRPLEITATNRLARPIDVDVAVTGPEGVTIHPAETRLTVPARSSDDQAGIGT